MVEIDECFAFGCSRWTYYAVQSVRSVFFLQRRCRMLEFVADCLLFVVMGSVGGITPVDKIYENALGHHYSESENPMRKMEREKS